MNQGRIIVITGAPGTGKTTTASAVAKESDLEKSVHMHTDDFYHYHVRKPSAREYDDCCNEFWNVTPYVKIIYLYYQDDKCVGKVKLRKNWNRYAYIEDIAVCKDFRGQGIGSALINISIEWAKHKNLHGLMLETQDNNLIACKFYHNCGFKIGSVDTMLYANFENNFEKAVFWYLRF